MKLSIVIPTIGRSTLKVVLESLLLNNPAHRPAGILHENIEILVIIDGDITSGDLKEIKKQLEVVFETQIKQGTLKLLATGHKAYAAGARNLGIKQATGEVIAFIGDDTIPEPGWLECLAQWHELHPEPQAALLGRVAWVDELSTDTFHQWLEKKALFDYARLDKGLAPTWRHFYTSNISVKKALLADSFFSTKFTGWGFEDSELGYRLSKKGMNLHYDSRLKVKHDDPQTLEALVTRTKQAHQNALVFESLHPEMKILPRGWKRLALQLTIIELWPLSFFPKIKWWRAWKKAWLG